ncbi:MAG: phage protein GemA/Gp16 family protein [candidate division WOR-3 bacterium]
MASKKQIIIIHTLKKKLGWDDEVYRKFLLKNTDGFCESSKEIADETLDRIIAKMKLMAKNYDFEDFNNREGMATAKQLRMISAMWKEVSYIKDEKLRLKALDRFVKKICGVDSIRFLKSVDVKKVVRAIQSMKERQS